MGAIDNNLDGEASFNVGGPGDGPDPVCCLFTETKFGGNVWCMGVAGGGTLPQWQNKAQSVSCHNGGEAWVYADSYNDKGGAHITGNVDDLASIPYGKDTATFSQNIKALWVCKG